MAYRAPVLCLFALALAVPSAGCRGGKSSEPPVHLNQNMDHQNRYEAQEASELFADGRAMRPPVEGVVARGFLKADDHLHRGRTAAGFALTLPTADDQGEAIRLDHKYLARGQERFQIFCVPCHDNTGAGNGIVVERGMMKPPSFHDERVLAMPIGQLYDVVTNGARNMSGYQGQIGLRDRWAIAAYVRALQLSRNAGLEDVPADKAGSERWQIR